MEGLKTSETVGAVAFGVFVVAMTVSRLVGGAVIDRWGRVVVLRATAVLAASGVTLVMWAPAPPWALTGAFVWGLGAALGFPAGMSAAADDSTRAALHVSVVGSLGYTAYAYDSHSGALLMSDDRATWDTISQQPLYELAARPTEPGTVYATTDRGVLVVSADGAEPVPVEGAPVLTGIDWQPGGPLVGVGPDGSVLVSGDSRTWREAGSLDGPTEALDAIAGQWQADTESGVYKSTDDGETWRLVLGGHDG